MSATIKMTPEELIENFEFLVDWEDRYSYLIELGKALPSMDEVMKNGGSLVKGCTSQVWMVSKSTETGKFSFLGDSDAHIVRGLVAILVIIYDQKDPEYIQSFAIENYFTQLGLSSHLSPNRRNGFFAMVEKIKNLSKLS